MLASAETCMHVRDLFTGLLAREVIDAMWGEHAPPDLEAMLVMEIAGRSDMVIAIPLGAAEAARWQAAAECMWAALSAEDPEGDDQASPGAGR